MLSLSPAFAANADCAFEGPTNPTGTSCGVGLYARNDKRKGQRRLRDEENSDHGECPAITSKRGCYVHESSFVNRI